MDLQEFKIKVFPLKNRLFRMSKQLLGDHEDAQDMVQEVFIKLWNRREALDDYKSIEAFAVVMTRNMCLDKLKSKKYPVENLENLKSDIGEPEPENRSDLSEIVMKIQKIIGTLPEQQRTIMHMRDIEGYDHQEIAGIMDMNENAVRVNLSRARKRVREILLKRKLYEYQRN